MSSFRKPYIRLVKAEGLYMHGEWQEGEETEQTFLASIQPLNSYAMNQLSALLQGRHISSAIKIYTDEILNVAGENNRNGDKVIFGEQSYLVVAKDVFQSDVINHYRYQAVRVGNNE